MSTLDWVEPGMRVAVYSGWGYRSTVIFTTVARCTSTQVITEYRGLRFRVKDGGQVAADRGSELLAADDDRVRNAVAVKVVDSLRFNVDRNVLSKVRNRAEAVAALAEVQRLAADALARLDATDDEAVMP